VPQLQHVTVEMGVCKVPVERFIDYGPCRCSVYDQQACLGRGSFTLIGSECPCAFARPINPYSLRVVEGQSRFSGLSGLTVDVEPQYATVAIDEDDLSVSMSKHHVVRWIHALRSLLLGNTPPDERLVEQRSRPNGRDGVPIIPGEQAVIIEPDRLSRDQMAELTA
jgi:hypothetical protein